MSEEGHVCTAGETDGRKGRWLTALNSDEEDPDEYPFPLTLRAKQPVADSTVVEAALNGS